MAKVKTYIKHSILFSILLLAINNPLFSHNSKSKGILADPRPFIAEQPNGEKISLFLKGDRMLHWYETAEGYTVLKSSKNYFEYATQNENGDLISSGITVEPSNNNKSSLTLNKNIRFSKSQIENKKLKYFEQSSIQSTMASDSFPTVGTNNVLVILAEFKDEKFSLPRSRFDSIMNAKNYNGTGSFKDYYQTNSHGKLTLNSTVTQWVTLPNNKAFYGENDGNGNDKNPKSLIRDAVDAAEKLGVDFSLYDNNNNGQVDGVVVVHAGFGEETGAGDDNLWSHRWNLDHLKVDYDNVSIFDYAMFSELGGTTGTEPINIGVICHEFGHILGLPDVYDTDYEGSGGKAFDLGTWDLMAGGAWNNDGFTPAGNNAYAKYFLKWIDLEEIDSKDFKVLKNSIESDIAFKINTKTENEFFILENRQQTSIDSFIPHHGLLIYHVEGNSFYLSNSNINVKPEHQGFDIEEADGTPTISTIMGDPFPGVNNISNFTDNTSPNALSWEGKPTEIPINFITEYTDGTISFYTNYSKSELDELNKVTIYVNNGSKPVFNAIVSLGDLNIYTDSKGAATFIIPDTSNINYTVSADNYALFEDVFTLLDEDKITIVSLNKTGINSLTDAVSIYPNPFHDRIFIKGDQERFTHFVIANNTGQIIIQEKLADSFIDLQHLQKGVYTLFLYSSKSQQSAKKQLLIKN